MMKQLKSTCYLLAFLLLSVVVFSQSPSSLMDEGKKLEMKFKEEEAIEKYRQAAALDATNTQALMKLSELSGNIGARLTDPVEKEKYYREAKAYADAVKALDSTSAAANYTMAVAYSRLSEVEQKRDSLLNDVKSIKRYAGNAIAADPNFGRAYNVLGRWHYEMVNIGLLKKSALKVLYGNFPEANIDSAVAYFEKCKSLEPYYCQNFYDLGKAYNFKRQYEKAIAILEQLAKLPTRRQDDPTIKKEGAALWQSLQ